MYKTLRKHQHGFFSCATDVLKFHKEIEVTKNVYGLNVLKIDGSFQASFKDEDYEDAVIYYGNKLTLQKNK